MEETERATPSVKDWFEQKLRCRTLHAGVLGLGQHGLPVAVCIAKAGFIVTGIDVNGRRVATINTGCVEDATVVDSVLTSLVDTCRLRATQSLMVLEHLDVVTVCVPTLLAGQAAPDLSCLLAAAEALRIHLHPGQLIVIDSQVPSNIPSTVLVPILHRSGLQVGTDFFLAQRLRHVLPGPWLEPRSANAPPIVGMTAHCQELATLYYRYMNSQNVTEE